MDGLTLTAKGRQCRFGGGVQEEANSVDALCVLCVCILMLPRQRDAGHVVRHKIGSFIA